MGEKEVMRGESIEKEVMLRVFEKERREEQEVRILWKVLLKMRE